MIARLWSARASRAQAPRYAEHLRGHVLPALRALAGFEGVTLLERDDQEGVEIVVMTWWRSLDDIRAFAGDRPDVAVVADEAQALLDRFDAEVRHFRVALDQD
jgi:heme-degrading monooxygenase HmoA